MGFHWNSVRNFSSNPKFPVGNNIHFHKTFCDKNLDRILFLCFFSIKLTVLLRKNRNKTKSLHLQFRVRNVSGKCCWQWKIKQWGFIFGFCQSLTSRNTFFQCWWIRMIYSGSGSSFEFSEFQIRIQAKVPDPCGSGSSLY